MDISSQTTAQVLTDKKNSPFLLPSNEKDVAVKKNEEGAAKLRWNSTTLGFFLLGLLIGLPAMATTTSANEMFAGITGVYEVCASLTAAIISFSTPLFARFISYNICTTICIAASMLSYLICTLPHPLEDSSNKVGPIIGTMLAGFVYSFGTNIFMAVAAFFPREAVLALSVGSGFSVILGPALYIGFMAAFDQDWRKTFLVFMPTVLGIPLVWWWLLNSSFRAAAENSRLASSEIDNKESRRQDSREDIEANTSPLDSQNSLVNNTNKSGFGPNRSRTGVLFKTIMPKYVLPLIICTSAATLSMMGTTPTLQALERLRAAPQDDLQFQLSFLSYGAAQFIFSTLAAMRPFPVVWLWTGIQVVLLVVGIIQIFQPFLTFYGLWVAVMFLVGGCVGAGVTNTNYKIAEDFRLAGEPDDVRSFAMSYSGLGNFGGDALGAALGVMVQKLATNGLKPGR